MCIPRGSFIFVKNAVMFLPKCLPMPIIVVASFSASSIFFIKAPLPNLTSRTIASLPAASFLLIILDAIRDIFSTVPVTSLRA